MKTREQIAKIIFIGMELDGLNSWSEMHPEQPDVVNCLNIADAILAGQSTERKPAYPPMFSHITCAGTPDGDVSIFGVDVNGIVYDYNFQREPKWRELIP